MLGRRKKLSLPALSFGKNSPFRAYLSRCRWSQSAEPPAGLKLIHPTKGGVEARGKGVRWAQIADGKGGAEYFEALSRVSECYPSIGGAATPVHDPLELLQLPESARRTQRTRPERKGTPRNGPHRSFSYFNRPIHGALSAGASNASGGPVRGSEFTTDDRASPSRRAPWPSGSTCLVGKRRPLASAPRRSRRRRDRLARCLSR